MTWKGESKRHRIAALKRKNKTSLRYRTRYVRKGYYQKLAYIKGTNKLKAVSGYESRKGKDKKLYEKVFK